MTMTREPVAPEDNPAHISPLEETFGSAADIETPEQAAAAHLDQPSMEERSVPGLVTVDSFAVQPVQDQTLLLNLGPQHPSTHGVARVLLELDGEVIKKAVPDIGYLHRGVEKIGEYRQYNQFVPWTDRLDYVAAFTSNL